MDVVAVEGVRIVAKVSSAGGVSAIQGWERYRVAKGMRGPTSAVRVKACGARP